MALTAVLAGAIGAGNLWSDAKWTPELALDLEGGTQIILTPEAQEGEAQPNAEQIRQAVAIIRQRVNGSGVSEAEVTTQGADSIVVALPGTPDDDTKNLVKQSAELNFRAVLAIADAQPQPAPSAGATPAPGATPGATPSAGATPAPSASASVAPAPSVTGHVASELARRPLLAGQTAPTPQPTGSAAPTPAPSASAGTPAPAPSNPSDLAQITPEIQQEFEALNCADLDDVRRLPDDPRKPLVTCSDDGTAKYILGPVEVRGANIRSATAGLGTNSQGVSTGEWQVQLEFDSTGSRQFADVTARLAGLQDAQNQFAIVLDRLVVSAPRTNERIPSGQAQISGSFTRDSATQLANQLKFGALPISFRVETEETISALLGGEQLQRGLLAGLIGLILVVIYSLLQYRLLGLVTVASLAVAGGLTYLLVVLLGWQQGYRLSLPGVTGLIVAIGITADSFIVFFERIRDEVRDGRALLPAVEAAWVRARRTILVSDAVSFTAAVVLYILAVGGVRGFAFTLGLTTLVDVLVVFLFTKPAVTLLARTRFFGEGHRFSGFSPEQLGRTAPAYTGRGKLRPPHERPTPRAPGAKPRTGAQAEGERRQSIAERRAAERAAARSGSGPGAGSDDSVRSGKDV